MYLSYIRIATTLPNLQLFLYPLLNPVIKTFTFSQTFVEEAVEKAVEKAASSKHYSREKRKYRFMRGGCTHDMRDIHLSFSVHLVGLIQGREGAAREDLLYFFMYST